MNVRISVSAAKNEKTNMELCAFIGNNINRWVDEYEKWLTLCRGETKPFKKEVSWCFAPEYKFEVKCNGKTLFVKELRKK